MSDEGLTIEQFSLLEQVSCPVALLDADLVVHFANPAFRNKVGDLLFGQKLSKLIANEFAVRQSISSASCISSTLPMRLEPLISDDALLCLISQVNYAGRKMYLIQGSQTDANRYYKLNREMEFMTNAFSRERRIAQEHENTCRAIEAFVEVLVHDIRSPLATVVQGMELLPMEMEADNLELSRRLMAQLKQSSTRLIEFVDSLYDQSEVHRAKLNLENVDLENLVQALGVDLAALISDVQGELQFDKMPIVQADRQLMRQLLQNLVQNSVKFRSPKRPLRIVIHCVRKSDSHLELSVQDNGIGFAPGVGPELFKPYRRSENEGTEGLGIGLATCKSIADKHGWSIRAEGGVDQGAKFTVRITSWC